MHAPQSATLLPFPVHLKPYMVAGIRTTRAELRAMLGEPHFVETDSTRTYGGDEDAWAYTLPSGQRVVVVLRVPYHIAVFSADPPELDPFLEALHIQSDDPR